VLAGDIEAFSILVERHGRRIFRTCLGMTRDPDTARDCVQRTFLLALERLGQFRAESRFSTWLTSIAIHESLTWLRRRSARAADVPFEHTEAGAAPLVLPDPRPDPEQLCLRAELRGLLRRALDALAPPYRDVVVLRDLEECSTRETARTLGISEPAVKTRLMRARLAMRAHLAPDFGFI